MSDDPNVNVSPSASTPEVRKRPYIIVFASDLGSAGRLAGLTPVDKEDFARVLTKARPALPLGIKSPFDDSPWEAELAFTSLKSFEPAELAGQFPAGRARLEIRNTIIERGKGGASADDIQRVIATVSSADATLGWLKSAASASGSAGGGGENASESGGSLLDLVDSPTAESRVASDISRLAAAAGDASNKLSAAERGRLNAILARLDDELGQIAEALLKNAEVRRLESAWRSLKFLVDRIDFREGTKLWVVDAPRDESVTRLVEAAITPAYNGEIETPGLIVFDYPCGNTPKDIDLLHELGGQANSLPVPVAFALEPSFFNVNSFSLIKNLPNLAGLVDGWQFAKWKSLREQRYAKALVPFVGNFVLRPPHECKGDKRDFAFRETAAKDKDLLWGGGHLALAVCTARSHAAHGWPMRTIGVNAGKIENLPVVPNPKDESKPFGPGDTQLADRRIGELPTVGINLLQSVKGDDYCFLLGGVSAAKATVPQGGDALNAMREISLPYQQFSNITSAYICEQQGRLAHQPPDEIQKQLMFGLRDLLRIDADDPDDAIVVGVGSDPNAPGQTVVQVRVTPPERIVPGGLHIEFGFAVPA